MNDLAILYSSNIVIYRNYIRSKLMIEVEAESAKAKINFASKVYRRKMRQEVRKFKKGAQHERPSY